MTKQEAIEAMKQGKKVTHRYFTKEEYISLNGSQIEDEAGYIYSAEEFWEIRTDDFWLSDWELWSK